MCALLLQQNGFQVDPIHLTINERCEENEFGAVSRLAAALDLDSQVVRYDFPDRSQISSTYAGLWDIFPDYNVVPFGRDLALAMAALPIALQLNCSSICMGHEHGTRAAYMEYQGKRIARDEVESTQGGLLLEQYLQTTISPNMRFFPPVGGLSEFRILHTFFTRHPHLMRHMAFCFWGTNCGRCSKCMRHYLMQRMLAMEGLLKFQANPLQGDNCPDLQLTVNNPAAEDRTYGDLVLYCLARLVERNDIRPGEEVLRRFAGGTYPLIKDRLAAIYDRMMYVHPDPQLPPGFRVG
jgi:hypothetical protein